ncbi:MAG TPA: serine/threonine-protein kinase [Ktedonobacteraceae bacterium]|nr:serine/threonine-protein kinase [Ktedonobacteraceae bacterium]
MHPHEPLSPGAIVGNRYRVVDLIGKGGFGAVYLVQDRQREDNFFALKETIVMNQEASERFIFECALLERLAHPSLPRVYHVFDNNEHNRLYMVMDYVEGPDLETLRQVQHNKRFSFPVIIAILTPIMDALAYLHRQNPPIIHRDIKPSNIIVPVAGGEAILIDFGIAKEYDTQRTTSAVRFGSPGYGAPEHYTTGTNARSDVYGLAATLYTLLTGAIPPEAIDRMTQLSNDDTDPLRPVNELVPTIPLHISKAIERAMAIRMTQRFATVQEFWQAVQGGSGQQPSTSEALNSLGVSSSAAKTMSASSGKAFQEKPARRSRKGIFISASLALLLILGIGVGVWKYTGSRWNGFPIPIVVGSGSGVQPPAPSPISHAPTEVPANSNSYPRLAPSYDGTITDLQANVASPMTLTQMRQKDGKISGVFNGIHMSAPYTGFIDTSNNIIFTIAGSGGSAPLYFKGLVQKNGALSGQFNAVDQKGDYNNGVFGFWNVAPTMPVKGASSLVRKKSQASDDM